MVDLPSYWLEHIGEDYIDLPNLTNLDHTLILEHNDSDDQENNQTWNRIDNNRVFSRRVLLGVTKAINDGNKLWSRSSNQPSTSSGDYAFALGGGGLAASDSVKSGDATAEDIKTEYNTNWTDKEDSIHVAFGKGSVITGKNNITLGEDFSAHGYGNIAEKDYQFVIGKFNSSSDSDVFQIGWGSSNSDRKNLFSVSESGNAWLASTLTQGSDSRLKENIQNLKTKGTLRLVEFDWKETGKHSYGFIADEVRKFIQN